MAKPSGSEATKATEIRFIKANCLATRIRIISVIGIIGIPR